MRKHPKGIPVGRNGHARGRLVKRPLGQVLLDGGFATRSDLERALAEQARTSELLGEVLVRIGVIDARELAAVLSIQGELASGEGAIRTAAGTRKRLGELLIDARRITPEQLERALREQKDTGEKLGEILVAMGHVSREQLDKALAAQRETGKRIGEILVDAGNIQPHVIEHGLRLQKKIVTAALLAALATAGHKDARPGTYAWPVSLSARAI